MCLNQRVNLFLISEVKHKMTQSWDIFFSNIITKVMCSLNLAKMCRLKCEYTKNNITLLSFFSRTYLWIVYHCNNSKHSTFNLIILTESTLQKQMYNSLQMLQTRYIFKWVFLNAGYFILNAIGLYCYLLQSSYCKYQFSGCIFC